MTLEWLILCAAFLTGSIVSSVMAVLLKREIVAAWSETLNGMARSIR